MKLIFCSFVLSCIIIPSYSKCLPYYPCRNFTLEFPFTDVNYPDCGLFPVTDCNSSFDYPRVFAGTTRESSMLILLGKISENKFLVRDLELHYTLTNRKCFNGFLNASIPQSPSVSFSFSPNLTLFRCYKSYGADKKNEEEYFQNYKKQECEAATVYYKTPAAATRDVAAAGESSIPPGCVVSEKPIKPGNNSYDSLFDLLYASFSLEWSVSKACSECYHGGGQCLADKDNKFYCKQGQDLETIVELDETIMQAECECCSLKEECTKDYIRSIRNSFSGKWVCGLCTEAVKERLGRWPLVGMEEAVINHKSFVQDFNTTTRLNPKLSLAWAMRDIAKKNSEKRMNISRAGIKIIRTSSCVPRIDFHTKLSN